MPPYAQGTKSGRKLQYSTTGRLAELSVFQTGGLFFLKETEK